MSHSRVMQGWREAALPLLYLSRTPSLGHMLAIKSLSLAECPLSTRQWPRCQRHRDIKHSVFFWGSHSGENSPEIWRQLSHRHGRNWAQRNLGQRVGADVQCQDTSNAVTGEDRVKGDTYNWSQARGKPGGWKEIYWKHSLSARGGTNWHCYILGTSPWKVLYVTANLRGGKKLVGSWEGDLLAGSLGDNSIMCRLLWLLQFLQLISIIHIDLEESVNERNGRH